DGNYEQLLESTKDVPSKYILTKNKKFSKVKILNEGLKAVPKDGIAMILDLQMQIPLDFFDRTRKLTIAGKTAFSPTLMHFQDPCLHERYTELALKKVIWQYDGPGIMAMYKSDWSRVGGFNEKMFADKWGGEDWELVDRIIATGIQIIHYRLPRFYHLYHSRKKMWNH
uniref:Hexosyltransferase n=1 Tax=Clytia hemisphaerica TaxID=252671 RepID=A0A7M6DS34_9CNID